MKLLIALFLVAAAGSGAYFKPWERPSEDPAAEASGWLRVTPKRRDLSSSVLATGIVRPSVGAEVAVGSRASGILAKLHCDVGTRVEAGDLLAELDPAEFEATHKQALAALENAVAQRDYAARSHARLRELQNSVVPVDEVDLAERTFRVAEATVQQSEASLELAAIRLDFTKIVAPIPGVVASVSTQVGETVAASFSAPTFLTIIDLLDDRGKVLRPEMTATIRIALDGGRDTFCIPNRAIQTDGDGSYVLVPGASGEPIRRSVTLGFRGREFTGLSDGLAPNEQVLVAQ